MQAKNARILLDLLGHFSLNEIRCAGALEAVMELQEVAVDHNNIYILVPQTTNNGLRKVDAIKTIRVLFGLGLKEAKDTFEAAFPDGITIRNGDAVRIGPFNYGGSAEAAVARLNEARTSGQMGCLEVEVE